MWNIPRWSTLHYIIINFTEQTNKQNFIYHSDILLTAILLYTNLPVILSDMQKL